MSNLNKAKTVSDFLKSELTKLVWKFESILSYVLAQFLLSINLGLRAYFSCNVLALLVFGFQALCFHCAFVSSLSEIYSDIAKKHADSFVRPVGEDYLKAAQSQGLYLNNKKNLLSCQLELLQVFYSPSIVK